MAQILKPLGVALAAMAMLAAAPALAQEVGTLTAVQTLVQRTNGPTLDIGTGIFLGDHLVSNDTGLGMVVFDDESSAKIGPNAELTIDSFVYTGSGGASSITLNGGLIRLYGGQISKSGNMQVTTPHIVLGARGGIIEILVGLEETLAILRAGQLTCKVGDIIAIITNPGFACTSDGETLKTGETDLDVLRILDSLDVIAGTGVPGSPGAISDIIAICATSLGDYLAACKSTDGGLPGQNAGGDPPGQDPMGSEEDGECEYYNDDCCYCEG
jgi:hypothetical protein